MSRGSKTGGRKKGARNKATAAKVKEISESGLTPLDFMMNILRSDMPPELKEMVASETLSVELIAALSTWHSQRFEAAKAAAPYVHPRLQNTTVKIPDGLDIRVIQRVIVRE